jgi:hypothetical protein
VTVLRHLRYGFLFVLIGSYTKFPTSRPYTIRLANRPPPTEVQVDGTACNGCWSYDGPELTLVVTTESLNTAASHTVEVGCLLMVPLSFKKQRTACNTCSTHDVLCFLR